MLGKNVIVQVIWEYVCGEDHLKMRSLSFGKVQKSHHRLRISSSATFFTYSALAKVFPAMAGPDA